MPLVSTYKQLNVWKNAIELAVRVFELTKRFPPEERYSMTDQIRRASRSIAANTAEAWRKRRYIGSFVSKLNDAEGEAAEVQTWCVLALRSGYWDAKVSEEIDARCEEILKQLVAMIDDAERWCRLPTRSKL
jgi:four helix bundle protein